MPGTVNINASVSLELSDGSKLPFLSHQTVAADQTGDGVNALLQNVGTSAEAITLGEVTTEGQAVFKNTDATNYVELGWDASGFQSAIKLLPGEIAICRLNSARTWQARANTAAVLLYACIFQE